MVAYPVSDNPFEGMELDAPPPASIVRLAVDAAGRNDHVDDVDVLVGLAVET
jgi:hypothetical protein